jgi:hypothetical protein
MKAIYTATAPPLRGDDDPRDHLFVSVDNEHWLEIIPPASGLAPDDWDKVRDLFGNTDGPRHIQLTTRYLRHLTQLAVTFHDPIVVLDTEATV